MPIYEGTNCMYKSIGFGLIALIVSVLSVSILYPFIGLYGVTLFISLIWIGILVLINLYGDRLMGQKSLNLSDEELEKFGKEKIKIE